MQPILLLFLIVTLIVWWDDFVVIILNYLSSTIFNANYGFTIIFFTLVLKLLFAPFSFKNDVNNKKRALLKPQVDQIKGLYEEKIEQNKDNVDTVDELKIFMDGDIKRLYRKNGIKNISLSGCLMLIFQIIMFIGFYRAIANAPQINGQSFLWFELGSPDPYYILPTMIFITMISYFLLSNTSGKTGLIIYISLSILLGVAFIKSISAIGLYFITVNLFGIFQVLCAKHIAKSELKASTYYKVIINDILDNKAP